MVVVRRGDEFLLLHRSGEGPAYEGEWAWTPPSGVRERGETIEACSRRELEEETGLELEPRLVGDYRWREWHWALFIADAPADAEVRLDPEHDASAWLPLEDACARCLPAGVADGLRTAARLFASA